MADFDVLFAKVCMYFRSLAEIKTGFYIKIVIAMTNQSHSI